MKILLTPEFTNKPEKAFSPHGTAVGLQMGAKAETLVYFPGFFRWQIRAPCPPMEWPIKKALKGVFAKIVKGIIVWFQIKFDIDR